MTRRPPKHGKSLRRPRGGGSAFIPEKPAPATPARPASARSAPAKSPRPHSASDPAAPVRAAVAPAPSRPASGRPAAVGRAQGRGQGAPARPAPAPVVHDAFAVTAPGLAPLCARELEALGIAVKGVEEAGVAFDASPEQLMRANLWLRTASRVLVRLAEFKAMTFAELEARAVKVPWKRVVARGTPVRLRVTCRKSRLYHSDAVAERLARAIAARGSGPVTWKGVAADEGDDDAPDGHELPAGDAPAGATPAGDAPAGDAPASDDDTQLIVVRFLHDRCTISVDSSGALLHRRGYRQVVGRAPLRETLAAAMLLAAGYDGSTPFVDPLCGSGALPIEAALIARRLPPGRYRRFAFVRWPGYDPVAWRALRAEADAQALPAAPHPILGSDRDAGAIEGARANAERAGVAADLTLERRPLSDVVLPEGAPGLVATNPPYGKRVGEADALRDLWARLGQLLALRAPGWRVAVLGPEPRLEAQLADGLGADLEAVLRTSNGGLPVRVLRGEVPALG